MSAHQSHVQVGFCVLRTVHASVRLPEAQPESTDDPDLGQINGSNSANDPDSSALIGLDALLQVLQNANASNVVSSPPPDSFDFSRPSTHVSESAVQVAATALNQLSQQDVQDPFANMILPVCSFSQRYMFCFFHFIMCLASTVPRLWDNPDDPIRTPTRLPQPEDHDFLALVLL